MKNDGTYFLTFQYEILKTKKYYPQSIHPFKWQGIEFFVHRTINGSKDNEPIYSDYFYQVTNKDTGLSLGIKSATRIADAKKQAIGELEDVGIDKVKSAIDKAMGIVRWE